MKIRLLYLFFFLVACFSANANVFVVTNKADTGAGTLRRALTLAAANGDGFTDYIKFNLPGNTELDRTILLKSELPLLSSQLIIDASTQPGPPLSNGIAKIIIRADRSVYLGTDYYYGCFNIINIAYVDIFGLAFDQFYSLNVKINPGGQSSYSSGIYIVSSHNINIGLPGKGNVFLENSFGVHASADRANQNTNKKIRVRSNWFGLELDGSDSKRNRVSHAIMIANESDFGGPELSYGNILGGFSAYGFSFTGANATVRFNRFGFSSNGNVTNRSVEIALDINGGEFSDNMANLFGITTRGKNYKILRNKEVEIPLSYQTSGIQFNYAENIQVGSDNLADANEFLPNIFDGPFSNNGSKNIELRKNIIHCTPYAYGIRDSAKVNIEVLVNTNSEYSGIASPNSEIYIYNDYTDCSSCSPLQFYTKVTADATGKWGITGNFSDKKFVSNATLIHDSSEFTQPQILNGRGEYWYIKKEPSCGQSNGTVELERPSNLLRVEWYNAKDEKVGEGFKVTGLPPGEYYAKGYNGKCYTIARNLTLYNLEPTFTTTALEVQQPACGKKNGSIKGLLYSTWNGTANTSWKWVDENNNTIATPSTDLNDLGPGSYTLVVTIDSTCTKSYGPILLQNGDGPSIERKETLLTPANCDNSDGSIAGVKAIGKGKINFLWKDDKGLVVSTKADLSNAKAGKYTLEVRDESTCGFLSSAFEIPANNTLTMDEELARIVKSTCGKANGSISGIKIVGNTGVKWLNEQKSLVGQNADLTGVPAGKYTLEISNAYCSKTSSVFTIGEASSNQNYSSVSEIKNATCMLSNGTISLNFGQAVPKAFKWVNEGQTEIGISSSITGLSAGFYKLYITDENLCESLYGAYQIKAIAPPELSTSAVIIENNHCGLRNGSIKGIDILGGTAPYRYEWRNQMNELVSTDLNLSNVTVGTYTLDVVDKESCSIRSRAFNILDETVVLPEPRIPPVQICAAGSALIIPEKVSEGRFLLYSNLTSVQPIYTTKDIFKVQVDKTTTYFVSFANGSCESNRVPVQVEVTASALDIFNSFSPNSDGANDVWKIKGLENYPEFELKIYTRTGQEIFSTKDPSFAFDGTKNNEALPVGVYFYMLKLRVGCSTISGSLTLVR